MQYTQDFISRVKELYPDCTEMHKLAEEGNGFLGRWLDDSSCGGFSPNSILNTSYEELRRQAEILEKKRELYADFVRGACYSAEDMRKAQCPSMYFQTNNVSNRCELEQKICVGVGYVGYFPGCKNWNCKEKCWAKYDEVK
jgi:hypothetical protein